MLTLLTPFGKPVDGTIKAPHRVVAVAAFMFATMLAGFASAGAGHLGPGDAQLSSGEYFDRVTFEGAAGDQVVIELSSSAFDPYLIVLGDKHPPGIDGVDENGVQAHPARAGLPQVALGVAQAGQFLPRL
ncbi:MAG: hypothetical protein R6W77_16185, partial [Trueperaceae bacterium]